MRGDDAQQDGMFSVSPEKRVQGDHGRYIVALKLHAEKKPNFDREVALV